MVSQSPAPGQPAGSGWETEIFQDLADRVGGVDGCNACRQFSHFSLAAKEKKTYKTNQ